MQWLPLNVTVFAIGHKWKEKKQFLFECERQLYPICWKNTFEFIRKKLGLNLIEILQFY